MKRSLPLALLAAVCLATGPVPAQDGPVCADCHDDAAADMIHNVHMRIQPFEVQGREVGCEGCHGDGAAHMEEGDPSLIRTFATAEEVAVCSDCHVAKGEGLHEWDASTHAMEGLTCLECHSAHEATNPLDSCQECHAEVYAQLQLPSHHPVREGRMSCTSCHNPHRATEGQLNTDMRLNDLCYDCHQSKEGPFIFEHEPVVEDCSLCHSPHGAVADNLLTANEPMLCLQCHEIHFHAALVSPEGETEIGGAHYENPFGTMSMNRAFTTDCTTCHSQVHGTDLPSQTLASGGTGMVR